LGLLDILTGWNQGARSGGGGGLNGYPPYEAPFRGPAAALTLEQADANLQYLLTDSEVRVNDLARFLGGVGVDFTGALRGGDVGPPLEALHAWLKRELPKLYDPAIAKRSVWLASTREGPEIVYSLLMDIALLLGALVIARKPEYRWALDLDPDNVADEMETVKRPVVQIPKAEPFPAPIILDVEAVVFGQYLTARSPVFGLTNDLGRLVKDAISGAYEYPWRT
jgi:hypothetical protein